MNPARKAGVFAGAAMAVLTLASCAAMNVSSYVERGVDLRQYRTFDWAPADQLATGDPRLDNNPFFQERVQTAVEEGMRAKGFEKGSSPDLLIDYHASMTQEIHLSGSARSDGSCEDCRPEVYDAGTIVIDLIDARSNGLVWRGWAKGSIDGVIDNQQWMERRVDEAVARILERLPRGL